MVADSSQYVGSDIGSARTCVGINYLGMRVVKPNPHQYYTGDM